MVLGCGVSFGETFNGTELFKSLEVRGERVAGAELTLELVVTQTYPVPVRIACYYEDGRRLTDDQKKVVFEERAILAGEAVLEPAEGSRPDGKAPRRMLTFSFTVARPGKYFIACITPASPDNGIGMPFTIVEGR